MFCHKVAKQKRANNTFFVRNVTPSFPRAFLLYKKIKIKKKVRNVLMMILKRNPVTLTSTKSYSKKYT